jgi:hypothetical protein
MLRDGVDVITNNNGTIKCRAPTKAKAKFGQLRVGKGVPALRMYYAHARECAKSSERREFIEEELGKISTKYWKPESGNAHNSNKMPAEVEEDDLESIMARLARLELGNSSSGEAEKTLRANAGNSNEMRKRMIEEWMRCNTEAPSSGEGGDAKEVSDELTLFHSMKAKKIRLLGEHPQNFSFGGAKHLVLSVLLDAGATDTFFRELFRSVMRNKKKSNARIVIADDTTTTADVAGVVPFFVLNTSGNPDVDVGTPVDVPGLIVPKLGQDLIAVTHFFEGLGYSLHLRPDGPCEFYRFTAEGEKETMPVRWDAVAKGFFMDVVTSENPKTHALAAAHVLDMMEWRSTERAQASRAASVPVEDIHSALCEIAEKEGNNAMQTNDKVLAARVAKHNDPLNCRFDLSEANGKLTREKAAKLFAHIGCTDTTCWVCRMVRGTKPYKPKIPDEMRVRIEMPNFRLTLDFIQWSSRSTQGNNFTANVKDVTSTMPCCGVHTVFKDDLHEGFADFLRAMRADPRFNWMSHPFGSENLADRDGVWAQNTKRWKTSVVDALGVRMRYSDPADHNSNALPELANKEMERRVKSLLHAKKLPPRDWEDCFEQAAWLKARLSTGNSFDGDNPRPLEVATNFQHPRKQISKELSAHIPIGTPALTWNAEVNKQGAKGSDLLTREMGNSQVNGQAHPTILRPFHKGNFPHRVACGDEFG